MFSEDTDRESGAPPRDAGSSERMAGEEPSSVPLEIMSCLLSNSHEPPDVQAAIRRQFAALVAFARRFSGIVTLNVLVLAARPG